MTKPIPILLDGDPGHDDAMAWMLAQSSPLLEIRGVTSVCGNQTIEKTTYNAQRVMTLLGIDAPLAKGRTGPLIAEHMAAPSVHGESGLDGPVLPEPAVFPVDLPACALMAKVLEESTEPVTLVPTGPLTNVASLLLTRPDLKGKIAGISMMGGGVTHGNWTPAAEFNILVDPEAADLVFRSGIPITMAGLDVTEKALVFPEDFETIRALGNPVASVVADWPELFHMEEMYVAVETQGTYCRGATIGDRYHLSDYAPNARVILDLDREGFVGLLTKAAASYG